MFNYEPYLKSLANFMADREYTTRPFPKVILDDVDQGFDVFAKTGYFDPESNGIRLFVHNRFPKDVLRTFAHELIHWKQQTTGELEKNGYASDKITEDEELIKLEAEAYLRGNLAFRSWTETMQKEGVPEELNEALNWNDDFESNYRVIAMIKSDYNPLQQTFKAMNIEEAMSKAYTYFSKFTRYGKNDVFICSIHSDAFDN